MNSGESSTFWFVLEKSWKPLKPSSLMQRLTSAMERSGVPKPMLPVLDTPVLHVAVQEALDAGVTRVVFIVSPGQEGVDSYFRRDLQLESALSEEGSVGLLERVRSIPEPDGIQIVVQSERLGLGHAILLARETLGDEAFAVLLPDDVIWDDTPTIGRMVGVLGERGGPVLAVKVNILGAEVLD